MKCPRGISPRWTLPTNMLSQKGTDAIGEEKLFPIPLSPLQNFKGRRKETIIQC
jgi:hypothetical protein